MIESRSTAERLTEGAVSSSSDKTRKDTIHILENLLDHVSEYEENLPFFQKFQELASIGGIDVLITLSYDNLRTL